MEREKITVFDMIVQIINGDQLSAGEEAEIIGVLEERKRKRKREEGEEPCLAAVVEKEMSESVGELGEKNELSKKLYQPIIDEYFWGTEIGNMPSSKLSEPIITSFISQMRDVYKLSKNQKLCFMGLLQVGLNKMAKESMLSFTPDKYLYRNYVALDRKIQYIDNPFTIEQTEQIRQWLNIHDDNCRNLCLTLFFAGGLSMSEIVNLKKDDCHRGILKEKEEIVEKALNMHPMRGEYIFMDMKKGRPERLTTKGLQVKLYNICEVLGIEYKKIDRHGVLCCV